MLLRKLKEEGDGLAVNREAGGKLGHPWTHYNFSRASIIGAKIREVLLQPIQHLLLSQCTLDSLPIAGGAIFELFET